MIEDVKELVEYRMRQAQETLTVARKLFDERHLRDAVNRAYYAMFYASLGLLASRMLGASKHSGVMNLFGQHFVKTGKFSREAGVHLREAFEQRRKSDYQEFVEPDVNQVGTLLADAGEFLKEAFALWEKLQREDRVGTK